MESQQNAQLFSRLVQELYHEYGGQENCPWSAVVLKRKASLRNLNYMGMFT